MRSSLWLLSTVFVAGCGARTGLLVDQTAPEPVDAGSEEAAIEDARAEDAPRDVTIEDAAIEDVAIEDVAIEDAAQEDALPIIEVGPDIVTIDECPDAGSTLVYAITEENVLYSFYPPTATFRSIGTIACPAPAGTTPFSMAVDRKGKAYVVFNDGALYAVSTADASCTTTSYVSGQSGFTTFGMGFASNIGTTGETLYLASTAGGTTTVSPQLGSLDTTTLTVTPIGDIPVTGAELTGTGDGRLFAFYTRSGATGSYVGQVDKVTAQIVAETPLPSVTQGEAWAFAWWGGDFWLFTAQNGQSSVTRYAPADGSVAVVTTLPRRIVGAGVSTCAPQ